MKEKEITTKGDPKAPSLSRYGDPDQRLYNPVFCTAYLLLAYAIELAASMLPVLFLLFGNAVQLKWIPPLLLRYLIAAVALDFAIPLRGSSYRQDMQGKSEIHRVVTEGFQHYFPGRSICLLKQSDLSPEKAYIFTLVFLI